eukprot:COSAG06_NODE_881_length_11798_cov_119.503205_5_plen_205_part_00
MAAKSSAKLGLVPAPTFLGTPPPNAPDATPPRLELDPDAVGRARDVYFDDDGGFCTFRVDVYLLGGAVCIRRGDLSIAGAVSLGASAPAGGLLAGTLPRCESHRDCVRLTRLTRASIRFGSRARSIDLTCLSASQQGQRDESIILAARRGGVERLTLSTLSRSSSFRSRSASSSFCSCVTAAATPQDADMERTMSGIGNNDVVS